MSETAEIQGNVLQKHAAYFQHKVHCYNYVYSLQLQLIWLHEITKARDNLLNLQLRLVIKQRRTTVST